MIDLKSYFQDKYKGGENFIENVIRPIFGEDKYEDAYEEDVLENNPELIKMAHSTGLSQILRLGTINIPMNPTEVFDITVYNHVQMKRNRVTVQQLIRRIMSTYSSAFMVFHYNDEDKCDWRFTFCSKQGNNKESTDSKRYTFLLGPGQSCRTAADNFQKLIDMHGEICREDIVKAFDVEALSKEFFDKYKTKYEKFCNFIYENRNDESLFGHEFTEWEEKHIRDYVKKLLGRIVFLHFLQKKGWLGVPVDKQWGEGDTQFMRNLFKASSTEQKDNYLDSVLEPLFSGALNTQRPNDIFDLHVEGFRTTRIPYLNGGLFELDALDEPKSTFPASYFEDLFEFFYQYNFTIDENDPNDAEVGIDPEMLGHIFENLLEDNKDKGAFYTPKEIVQYMCRESLIAYLTTCVVKKQGENHKPEEKISESVRRLLTKPEEIVPKMTKEHLDDFGSYIRNVKICDPAIGSGAFPMGLLNELVRCRVFINAWAKDEKGNLLEGDYAALKTEIISNNIYGVDIEKGAIDIARLRFWLSIIVDEHTPHVLPNFDYKFMQGNSLIPTFNGKFINLDTKSQKHINVLEMRKDKQHLYELKQQYYKAEGDIKHELNIQIKDTILKLISRQLGYESRSWYQHNVVQTLFLFDDVTNTSFDKVRQFLPEEKQQSITLAESLHAKLNDKSIPVAERSQIDIHFFDWRIMFTEVFDNGSDGFDIVIGNPPYGASLSFEIKDIYKSLFSDVHMRTPDTYNYFISQGYKLLREKGVLSYIVPNTLLSQNEYEKTRIFLTEKKNLSIVINIGENVFKEAIVPTCIIVGSNQQLLSYNINYIDYKGIDNDQINWDNKFDIIPSTLLKEIPGHVIGVDLKSGLLLNKIQQKSVKIDDIAFEMAAGISTGCNKAFCVDEEEIVSHNIEHGILKPLLIGRDIDRYITNWNHKYIIYTTRTTNIKIYPNALAFAFPFKDKLDKRRETKKGMIPWWALNWPRYVELFTKEKIIMRQTSDSIRATYDDKEYFPLNSILTLKLKENCGYSYKYILGILNSKLNNYIYQSISQEKGRAFAEVKPINVRKLYVPVLSTDLQVPIIHLVDQILYLKKQDPQTDTSTLEAEIDQLVYQFYGLSDEEIAIVEG